MKSKQVYKMDNMLNYISHKIQHILSFLNSFDRSHFYERLLVVGASYAQPFIMKMDCGDKLFNNRLDHIQGSVEVSKKLSWIPYTFHRSHSCILYHRRPIPQSFWEKVSIYHIDIIVTLQLLFQQGNVPEDIDFWSQEKVYSCNKIFDHIFCRQIYRQLFTSRWNIFSEKQQDQKDSSQASIHDLYRIDKTTFQKKFTCLFWKFCYNPGRENKTTLSILFSVCIHLNTDMKRYTVPLRLSKAAITRHT